MEKRTKENADRIWNLAVSLCEKKNIRLNGFNVRRIEVLEGVDPCFECKMDYLCDDDLIYLCALCDSIAENKGYLKLNL